MIKLFLVRHGEATQGWTSKDPPLSDLGKSQALSLAPFIDKIDLNKVDLVSSPLTRCKETAKIAFRNFSTNSFLNSFYSLKYAKNKDKQVIALNDYVKNFESKKNLILVTHYVLISEVLNYGPSSGEIVVSDKNLNIIDTIEINY